MAPKELTGYEGLAEAIITRAVKDYRTAKRGNKSTRQLEEFFKSGYFMMLAESCGLELNGNEIMEGVKESIEKKIRETESD